MILVASERFADHVTPPGHPERSERAEVFDVVASRWTKRGAERVEPRPARREDLMRVHAPAYVDSLAATAGRAASFDPDTYTSPASYEVALLAAGAACLAVDAALDSGGAAAALVRPPGHHAERDRAMGFCLLNNAAVAAAYARAERRLARVAIVDFDVHHGNGTQWMFYNDPTVLYLSVHQYPFYPGTGSAAEMGAGGGAGFTVNIPLEAGATDADYDHAFRSLILPLLEKYEPELLIASAGYDAHHRDPLAGMRVSTEGFAAMAAHLRDVAERRCGGRTVIVVEGGYDLPALADGLEVTFEAFNDTPTPPVPIHGDAARARDAVKAARAVLQPYWPTL